MLKDSIISEGKQNISTMETYETVVGQTAKVLMPPWDTAKNLQPLFLILFFKSTT